MSNEQQQIDQQEQNSNGGQSQQQEQKPVEEKKYTQSQFDSAIASARKYVKEKYEKKISEITKRPSIEKALIENGCKSEAVDAYIKLNPEILQCDTKDLKGFISKNTEKYEYMFEKKPFNADPFAQVQTNGEKQTKDKLKVYSRFFGK